MPRSRRAYLRTGAIALGAALAGCSSRSAPGTDPETDDTPTDGDTPSPTPTGERIDDWQYDPTTVSIGITDRHR